MQRRRYCAILKWIAEARELISPVSREWDIKSDSLAQSRPRPKPQSIITRVYRSPSVICVSGTHGCMEAAASPICIPINNPTRGNDYTGYLIRRIPVFNYPRFTAPRKLSLSIRSGYTCESASATYLVFSNASHVKSRSYTYEKRERRKQL